MDVKEVLWVGSSRDDQRALPREVRRELGFDLRRVQQGRMPRESRKTSDLDLAVARTRLAAVRRARAEE